MKSEKDEQDRLRDLDVLKTGPSWPRLIPSLTVEKGFYRAFIRSPIHKIQ